MFARPPSQIFGDEGILTPENGDVHVFFQGAELGGDYLCVRDANRSLSSTVPEREHRHNQTAKGMIGYYDVPEREGKGGSTAAIKPRKE
eukprot:6573882-Prymnesium_polylepis.1